MPADIGPLSSSVHTATGSFWQAYTAIGQQSWSLQLDAPCAGTAAAFEPMWVLQGCCDVMQILEMPVSLSESTSMG